MAYYSYIVGFKGRGYLLYSHNEKNLFVKKSEENNMERYECYQNVIAGSDRRCPVYCMVEGDKITRNDGKHCHADHNVKYKDLVSLNAMRKTCVFLKENLPSSAFRISLYDIFLQEISK